MLVYAHNALTNTWQVSEYGRTKLQQGQAVWLDAIEYAWGFRLTKRRIRIVGVQVIAQKLRGLNLRAVECTAGISQGRLAEKDRLDHQLP